MVNAPAPRLALLMSRWLPALPMLPRAPAVRMMLRAVMSARGRSDGDVNWAELGLVGSARSTASRIDAWARRSASPPLL